jgi:uncharacterized membrane protein
MTIAILAVLLGAVGLIFLGWLGLIGRLPPNHFAGIRTPFTRKSEEHWYETHRQAGSVLVLGAVAVLAAGLALLPFALAGALPDTFVTILVVVMGVMLATSAIAAWLVGTRRAQARLS